MMSLKKGTDREDGEIQIGDTVRLLLNQNEKGEHNIMTAVHRKNAVKVVNWNEERKAASSEASKENQ